MQNEIKLYKIEKAEEYHYEKHEAYRFRSLFNGCVGMWHSNIEEAMKEGEIHQRLLMIAYDNLKMLNS